jgi:hypothetical protein
VRAFAEVPHLDETSIQKALEDVIDLAEADAGVLGELALVDDWLPVKGVEDFEGLPRKIHSFTSHQKNRKTLISHRVTERTQRNLVFLINPKELSSFSVALASLGERA